VSRKKNSLSFLDRSAQRARPLMGDRERSRNIECVVKPIVRVTPLVNRGDELLRSLRQSEPSLRLATTAKL